MVNHVGDTRQAVCHNAWQRPMHVGHKESHVCDKWQVMCVTHGMPCVNMHGTFEDYIRSFTVGLFVQARGQERGGREKRKGGKEKRKRGKEKRKKGKERRKGGKEKKRKEEKRRRKRRKRGKRKRKRKECRTVSKLIRQRNRNYATRGRFPPTLVILRLRAM